MNAKINILFLCGWYPSRVLPDNGDFILRHAEAVSSIHNITVIHLISDENCKEKIEFSTEEKNNITTHIAYLKPTTNYIIKIFRFLKAFKILLKKTPNFKVVHVHKLFPFGIFALFINFFRKKDFLITEHWTGYHKPQCKNISKLEIFLSKIIAKKAKYICPVSNDLKLSMEDLGLKGNYKIVPNVVDTEIFIPVEKNNEKYTILHVSNMLDKHKNVSGILQTIKTFLEFTSNFELLLVGKNVQQYESLVQKLNISDVVTMIDHVPHKKIIHFMQKADVFVLFSNYENLPCVILESFSCGTNVISTNVGGISEYFPENFGFLIEPNNEKQLLEKLVHIYQNPFTNGNELHAYAKQHFSKKVVANNFSKLYTSCT